MARSNVPSEERVFSLVLALIASEQGLTKHDLLSSVYGYSERFRESGSRASLERQFERDKELLRDLGVPVQAIDSPGEPGNNQLTRYRVPKESFEVPAGLEFTERELMMLRLAALAWKEGSLEVESRRASMKLESLSGGKNAPQLGVMPDFGTSEPAAPALLAAIERGEAVEFAYRLPSKPGALRRRVLPLRLHRFERRWHLIAYDLDRDAGRVFLLSRIEGQVAPSVVPAQASDGMELEALVDETIADLQQLQTDQQVLVRVPVGSVADAALSKHAVVVEEAAGARTLRFGTVDLAETASVLAGYGGEIDVLDPPTLRDRVIALFREVAAAHRDGVGGGAAGTGSSAHA